MHGPHVYLPTVNLSYRAGPGSAERGDLVVPRTATELGRRKLFFTQDPARHSAVRRRIWCESDDAWRRAVPCGAVPGPTWKNLTFPRHSSGNSLPKTLTGICDTAHQWFRSYLSGRKQHVPRGSVRSSTICLVCGVPQGSVLGPILFVLYTIWPDPAGRKSWSVAAPLCWWRSTTRLMCHIVITAENFAPVFYPERTVSVWLENSPLPAGLQPRENVASKRVSNWT